MLVRIYEYFLYKNPIIPTLSFISYLVGIGFIFLFNRRHCWALSDFGIQDVRNNTFYELILPSLIWLGSAAVIILPEFIITTAMGAENSYFDFVSFNQHVGLVLSKSDNAIMASWTLMGAIICVLRALFLEVYFRGLCFGVFRKKTGFYLCNTMQALFFGIWYLVAPSRAFVFSDEKGKVIGMMLIFFAAQFCFAFRQGYVRLVCNTVWPCIITTFLYNMFTFTFVLTGFGGEEGREFAGYIRWLIINLVMLLLTFPYCKMMKKKFPPPKPTPEEEKMISLEKMRELEELNKEELD